MGNTTDGAQKGVETTKKKYGKDHYSNIGKKGGKKSAMGSFRRDPEFARKMALRRWAKTEKTIDEQA